MLHKRKGGHRVYAKLGGSFVETVGASGRKCGASTRVKALIASKRRTKRRLSIDERNALYYTRRYNTCGDIFSLLRA